MGATGATARAYHYYCCTLNSKKDTTPSLLVRAAEVLGRQGLNMVYTSRTGVINGKQFGFQKSGTLENEDGERGVRSYFQVLKKEAPYQFGGQGRVAEFRTTQAGIILTCSPGL